MIKVVRRALSSERPGAHRLALYLISDCLIGADQEYECEISVTSDS